MSVVHMTTENFETEVRQATVPVLLDFYADWCAPCQMLAPIISSIAQELGPRIKVGKLDVDKASAIASHYGIMSIPTLMLFKGGEVIDTKVGVVSKADISEWLQQKVFA